MSLLLEEGEKRSYSYLPYYFEWADLFDCGLEI